jgi:multicomponent Na+:H+ antiporter subunit E
MNTIILRTLFFALVWWILAEGRADGWAVGLVFITLAVVASLRLLPPERRASTGGMATGLSLAGLLAYAGFFLVQSLRGGFQVAAMALRPRLALAPALFQIPLRLPAGPAHALLTATLSLLPGTLSVRLEGATLSLHALDARLPIEHEVRAAEAHVARLFGIAL